MVKNILLKLFLWYIKNLAKLQLRKTKPLIIGITGSSGKTSVLNAIEAVLKALPNKKISVSHKANSELGLPLHILGITTQDFSIAAWSKIAFKAIWQLLVNWQPVDIYVAEMGVDSPFAPKNMSYLLSFLKPQIGIFLNAEAVHSEAFDSLVKEIDQNKKKQAVVHAIAQEKGKLITSLPKNGFAILNRDDSEVSVFSNKTKAQVLFFGQKNKEDEGAFLINWQTSFEGTKFIFKQDLKEFSLNFPQHVLPEQFGLSLAAVFNLAKILGITQKEAVSALEKNLVNPPGRSSLFQGKNNSYILDSTYNASVKPMEMLLELLDKLQAKRKIAVLGDMREMGDEAKQAHLQIAKKASQIADLIILIGPLMKEYALPYLEQLNGKPPVYWFSNAHKAADFLLPKIQPNDCALVKASQNTLLLEIAVEKLLANPEDEKYLCRRGKYWNLQRQKLLNQ